MSENKTPDSYEVGFGKPPKHTQFRKGVSGNPTGRPKKALDFDDELLRESRTSITINENGRRRSISKHAAVIKQLINQAMKGDRYAARTYLDHYVRAFEKVALVKASESRDPGEYDVNKLSDQEIMNLLVGLKDTEQGKKGNISNMD
jgi:Family of unknown function (DUF5681)